MKIKRLQNIQITDQIEALDCCVGGGYVKAVHGSLPDVDVDFESEKRQQVKEYLELRYGRGISLRVFSAGTFTTEKVKSAMKDIAAVHKIPRGTTNYVTAIIKDDNLSWTGMMKQAVKDKTLKDFIQKYPTVFEEMRPILDQPRAAGIHASALIITPRTVKGKEVECYELLPVRKQKGLIVSEISGADIDAIGLLKNDVLGIAELSRIKETFDLVQKEYGRVYTMEQLIDSEHIADESVYQTISDGFTQGLFQLSSPGMTKFIKQMKPSNIEYLIAAVALFRPATIESGSVQKYVDIKNGDSYPEYLWGTENALKSTFSCLIYQEQLTQMARDVGGFSLGDGVKLVKFISKKKVDKIKEQKGKFMAGAKERGCPKDSAEAIWAMMEAAGSYCFNKCVSANERFGAPDSDTDFDHRTVEEHFKEGQETGDFGYAYSWNENSLHPQLVKNKVVEIRYAGYRRMYRVTLEDGECIDCTLNHKHPTRCGERRTDELEIGIDEMLSGYSFDDGKLEWKKVVDVSYISDGDVYDVEMAEPHHNFANKYRLVTHNSHATAYAATAYVGAWLKTHYPVAFYTVQLKWVDDEKLPVLMKEIEELENVSLAQPNINVSGEDFNTDFKSGTIYWSLVRIKQVGAKAVAYIVQDRAAHGKFVSLRDFAVRIFKQKLKKMKYKGYTDDEPADMKERCPVTSLHLKHLIMAGAFDEVEHLTSASQRYILLKGAAMMLGFEMKDKDAPPEKIGKEHYWQQKQIDLTGFGAVDYRKILNDSDEVPGYIKGSKFLDIKVLSSLTLTPDKYTLCATIVEAVDKTYTDKREGGTKHFGKVKIAQNNDIGQMLIWSKAWEEVKPFFIHKEGQLVVATVRTEWSDYDEKNIIKINNGAFVMNME